MDDRTVKTLSALDEAAVSLLYLLLEGPATEAQLLESLNWSQPTINRHLERLQEHGLLSREPGNLKAPGREWSLAHPEEIDALLSAALALTEAVQKREAQQREEARKALLRARAKRRGLRVVDGDGPTGKAQQ